MAKICGQLEIPLRIFPVQLIDGGEAHTVQTPVTKQQLDAARLVGESSKELLTRHWNRLGWKVGEIGTPRKTTVTLNFWVDPHTGKLHVSDQSGVFADEY